MKKRVVSSLVLLFVSLLPLCVLAQKSADDSALETALQTLLATPAAAQASWGIEVEELSSGRVLYSLNSGKLFTPASSTKLFTTSAALALAGDQYRIQTTLEAQYLMRTPGRVNGDLFLTGRGDATLNATALEDLASQLAARGITAIDGNIVGDDRYFAWEPVNDEWLVGDLTWDSGAPVSALSFDNNTVAVRVTPGARVGDAAFVEQPREAQMLVDNRVMTIAAGGKRSLILRREPWSHTVSLQGEIPVNDRGITLRIAAEDPAYTAAAQLASILRQHGIEIKGVPVALHVSAPELASGAETQSPRTVLASHNSAPLIEDIRTTNKHSQNLHAEMLLRLTGRITGGDGTKASALAAERYWLLKIGLGEDEFVLYDGCGLARPTLATPRAFTKLLRYAATQPWGAAFRETLPVGGVDGTLASRPMTMITKGKNGESVPVKLLVQAKTGSVVHVNTLSGYMTTASGKDIVFSIMVNNHMIGAHKASLLIDQIVEVIAESL